MAAAVVGDFPASRAAVTVVDYDPRWTEQFRSMKDQLKRALGGTALSIEHVGSTSVPELPAKPIIDVDIVVANADDEDKYISALGTLGMRMVIREPWWHGHRMFVDDHGAANIHIWPDGAAEPVRHILFRDWLRTHQDDLERYAQVKRNLSVEFNDEPDRYNLAKNTVIDQIYARIFAAGPGNADTR